MRFTLSPIVAFLSAIVLVASSPLSDIPINAPANANVHDVTTTVPTQLTRRCNSDTRFYSPFSLLRILTRLYYIACGSDDLLGGLLGDVDVGTDVDATVNLDQILDLDAVVRVVLDSNTDTPSCRTPGCNEDDIVIFLKDLNIKINATLALLGDEKDSQKDLLDLVAVVDVALQLLTKVDIDTSKEHGNQCNDLVNLVASLLSARCLLGLSVYSSLMCFFEQRIAASLSTCGTLDLDVTSKIDVVLSKLLVMLDLHVYGLAGLCGASVTNVDLFVGADLKLTLQALGL
ncbi:hypothetical protein BS47DRAFT_1393153 [Hydnum rufescens UP504]|uniref:Uncharacterized protein n=1 Tax=Hydnum rufescens UP504 TaxID=1448309 RepID=A0A9P6DTT3_9AGAM|nr:hypothetical protein BS47DRAFT_1393153 [Hydnum rufescens UP504]